MDALIKEQMLLEDFYSVVNSSAVDGHYQTSLRINKEHEIFRGHFPQRPVTPGVILMQLFKEEAERQTGHKLQLQKGNNVKFMAVVDPNKDSSLLLESEITKDNSVVKLKGIAKSNESIVLKINAIYAVRE
ncbi:MAG: hydroxymyristoyl-ACP dehydratase [Salegentibacter sp.]